MNDVSLVDKTESAQQPDNLLQVTIHNQNRLPRFRMFDQAWRERWDGKRFQTNEDESPFAQFSSRG